MNDTYTIKNIKSKGKNYREQCSEIDREQKEAYQLLMRI